MQSLNTRVVVVGSSALGKTVDNNDTEDSACKPHDHGQEGESLSGLPLSASVGAMEREANPVPGATTASAVEPVYEHGEYCGPSDGEDYIYVSCRS